ncbi:hypothetical protein KJ570_03720 [Patescibacteria group bacterium]|nr:hypothetical protein [Patescibacteria group bacterium]MBU2036390.1 hypothetical protein [Patescibacteria group bacterium]
MERDNLIEQLNRKSDHLATQFGSNSKIRKAYLRITELVVNGETFPDAIEKVILEFDKKATKNQS